MIKNFCSAQFIVLYFLMVSTTFGQLESTVPVPTKENKTTSICVSDSSQLFPTDTLCYLGKTVILLTPDSLKGKQVFILGFKDSLIQNKYDEYSLIYLVSKDIQNGLIYNSFISTKYNKLFSVPSGICVRNLTIDYYKKRFQNKTFFALEKDNYSSAFYIVDQKLKDPFTGDLFSIDRTDPLEFSKLMILDSVKTKPEIVAIFKFGKRHLALFLSEFQPNSKFGLDFDLFFLDKSRSERIKKNFGIKLWQAMMDEEIQIGMSDEMVRIAWGLPNKINENVTLYGSQEQWIYGSRFVYFQKGKCTGWN